MYAQLEVLYPQSSGGKEILFSLLMTELNILHHIRKQNRYE